MTITTSGPAGGYGHTMWQCGACGQFQSGTSERHINCPGSIEDRLARIEKKLDALLERTA